MNLATLKLIGYGVGALAIIGLLAMVNGWRVERNHLRDWQTQVVAAARDASDSPKLAAKDVPAQIKLLGQGIATLKASIANQNAAIAALGKQSSDEQAAAAQASKTAVERASKAQATSERLNASSRAGEAQAKPCAPSKALSEAWK